MVFGGFGKAEAEARMQLLQTHHSPASTTTMNEPPTMPHAPYPPAIVPMSQQRNNQYQYSMGSNSGGGGGGGSSSRGSSSVYSSSHNTSEEQRNNKRYSSYPASSSSGGGAVNESMNSNRTTNMRNKQSLPSRISFVPGAPYSDLYGAINCSPLLVNGTATTTTADHANSTTAVAAGGGGMASRLKYGPPLLEIRRMKYSLHLPPVVENCIENDGRLPRSNNGKTNDGDNSNEEENKEEIDTRSGSRKDHHRHRGNNIIKRQQQQSSSSLVQHETILVSRGIPGLGNSVSSTSLDFRPLNNNNNSAMVRCATGLTSGALCIHSLSNLFNNDDAADADAPSSTVAHYAPRQQRPATSVAWRPTATGTMGTTSNLVAIGLVGSSGVGISGSSITGGGGGGGSSAGGGGGGGTIIGSSMSKSTLVSMGVSGMTSSSMSSLGVIGGSGGSGHHGVGSTAGVIGLGNTAGGDRDFGTLVWDIEAQSSVVSGAGTVVGAGGKNNKGLTKSVGKSKGGGAAGSVPIKTPAYRFAHNSGVESLSWLSDGQILAVGCQKRNVQLYDLRVSGTNAPPVSVFAHTEAVAGIVSDNMNCPTKMVFATFGRNVGEPVKIWDARMMDSTLGEIIPPPPPLQNIHGGGGGGGGGGGVSAIAWPIRPERPGVLSVAIGNTVRTYDTRSPGSRALPVGVSYVDTDGGGDDIFVQSLSFQPQSFRDDSSSGRSSLHLPIESIASDFDAAIAVGQAAATNPFESYPHRTLAVTSQGQMKVIPESQAAPLAVSKRDGRIAIGLGGTVWVGPSTDGPSAMEGQPILNEDISARMMRRARCFHASRYSTDARDNVRMLEEEKEKILAQEHLHLSSQKNRSQSSSSSSKEFNDVIANIDQHLHCWRWIALVEHLSIDQRGSSDNEMLNSDDIAAWPAKGLIDAGVLKLLRMSSRDVPDESNNWMDTKKTSDTLFCDVFDSPMRRAALNACGWIKKYGALQGLLDECEGRGEFERSAALAVWHGDLNSCVSALQRGAEDVKALLEEEYDDDPSSTKSRGRGDSVTDCESYSETLNLIAMCVAGFNVTTASEGGSKLWRSACENLLRRPGISATDNSLQVKLPGASYLRAILLFLQNIGNDSGFKETIFNEGLSLADRVGFACLFLPRANLHSFLDASMRKCIKQGNIGGLLISGLDKRGIGMLQSYIDRNSDVQTAALISCRVQLPTEWTSERRMSLEWLESYRLLLNTLQMWHSRAAFDVGRFEHLRRQKQGGVVTLSSGRHLVAKKQHQKDKSQANNNFPPQLWARCNYCNASLPLSKLRRQEGIANSWLSRQKPVLTCCPQCKKPLPRCSICLLSLGCLNPYMELQRERNQYPRGGMPMLGSGGGGIQGMDDLSGLASIPFATWFSWCMRCKHGGHAHHLCGWFEKHDTCAVSGCDCQCQFDGIEKLSRPGLQ